MQELIASYLFQNKNCPLPGIGTLSIGNKVASFVQIEKQLYPPKPFISFSLSERSVEDFIRYVSIKQNISIEEATGSIENYCSKLNNLDSYSEMEITYAGKFYVNAEGGLVFKEIPFPEVLLPPVTAERIIHPDATHNILVGDKESNSALMTEFYSETEPVKKSRWWVWAIVLAFLAFIAIIFYFISEPNPSSFGNSEKAPSVKETKTYKRTD